MIYKLNMAEKGGTNENSDEKGKKSSNVEVVAFFQCNMVP